MDVYQRVQRELSPILSVLKRPVLVPLMLVCLGMGLVAGPAYAFEPGSGAYFGFGGGGAVIFDFNEDDPIDDGATALKGFLGLQPASYVALEAGYADLGTLEGQVSGVLNERRTDGYYADGILVLPIGSRFDLFFKGGGYLWEVRQTAGGSTVMDDDGVSPTYGAGFSLLVAENRNPSAVESISMDLRVDWDHFRPGDDNLETDLLTFNLVWHFR